MEPAARDPCETNALSQAFKAFKTWTAVIQDIFIAQVPNMVMVPVREEWVESRRTEEVAKETRYCQNCFLTGSHIDLLVRKYFHILSSYFNTKLLPHKNHTLLFFSTLQ